jgi:hypothetical protein
MFFLLRCAFWLSLVVLLIPIGETSNENTGANRSVSTFEAIGAAHSTWQDVRGFCDRNPDTCATGRVFADDFAAKARTGARWVYDQLEPREGPATGSTPSPAPTPAVTPPFRPIEPTAADTRGAHLPRPVDGPLPIPRPAV